MKLPPEIEEKLKSLVEEAVKEASDKITEKLEEAEREALKILERYYQDALKEAKQYIEKVKRSTEVEARKKTASAEIKARHMMLDAKEKLLNEVVEEAKLKFREIIGLEAYGKFIERLVRVVITNLGSEEVILKSTARDYDLLLKTINKLNLKDRVKVVKGDVKSSGGFIAQTQDGRSSLDLTLDSIFEAQRDNVRMSISKILFGGL